ncbi:MAG: cyclic-di-AMP receptor [Bacillota bacterium]|nr:cyclic-di-AMP receptor [Bacillota bacterium]
MKLVITVVEDNDVAFLMESLIKNGYQATKLASTGGFLLQGNTTLLIGVQNEQVEPVLEIIRSTCAPRKKIIPQIAPELPTAIGVPVEIEAGGAIVFVIDIQEFWKL